MISSPSCWTSLTKAQILVVPISSPTMRSLLGIGGSCLHVAGPESNGLVWDGVTFTVVHILFPPWLSSPPPDRESSRSTKFRGRILCEKITVYPSKVNDLLFHVPKPRYTGTGDFKGTMSSLFSHQINLRYGDHTRILLDDSNKLHGLRNRLVDGVYM